MYCLIQLYMPISQQLAPHKPLLKLFSVKAVVFLTFWQATGLSVLTMFGVVKDTNYMTAEDINTGISAILETFEMMYVLRHLTPNPHSLLGQVFRFFTRSRVLLPPVPRGEEDVGANRAIQVFSACP